MKKESRLAWRWFLANNPLPWFDPQVQFQLAVNPIDPLVIPWITLHIAQKQKTQPKSPVTLIMGEADKLVGDFNILCRLFCLVAVTGLADAERQAGKLNADAPIHGD